MPDLSKPDQRLSLGARLTLFILRAIRAKTPLDVHNPQALIAARATLDKMDDLTGFRLGGDRPWRWADTHLGGVGVREGSMTGRAPANEQGVLLFIHGGGFFFRSLKGHTLLAARIARGAGLSRVVLPLYRLSPEHVFPAALNDCVGTYRALLSAGTPPEKIVMAGDSAGAALVLGTIAAAREQGLPAPRAVALMSPLVDLTYSAPSITIHAERDPVFGGAPMPPPTYYLGAESADSAKCSPLFADLAGFPPLFIQVGGTERLLDDSVRLEKAAQAVDVSATLEIWPEMPHVFQMFDFPEARQARGRMSAFLSDGLKSDRARSL